MKPSITNILILFSVMCLAIGMSSCTQDQDLLIDSGTEPKVIKAHFTVDKIEFDSQGRTRSGGSGTGWSNGEIIYLIFSDTVTGIAHYNNSSDKWNITLNGNLQSATNGKLEAYYFDGNPIVSSGKVTLTARNGIYYDSDGIYSYSENGDLNIGVILRPKTSRIRFKGEPGVKITIDEGIYTYSEYIKLSSSLSNSSYALTNRIDPINLTVGSDGYTPYVYGIFTNSSSPYIKITNGYYVFTTNCPATMFKVGESGWMNLPNQEEHNGWTLATDASGLCPDTRHPHKVDMGFGVKFACCNLGASTPFKYGDYFAWGETSTKEKYKWSTYKWCDGSDNGIAAYETYLSKYCTNSNYGVVDNKTQLEASDDAARVNWGGTWRMPTGDELTQLYNTCTWEKTTINRVYGYKVIAKNGNAIFLPHAGYFSDEHYSNSTTYWSSSLYPGNYYNNFAMQISFYSEIQENKPTMEYNFGRRYIGRSIRPVSD